MHHALLFALLAGALLAAAAPVSLLLTATATALADGPVLRLAITPVSAPPRL